MFYLCAKTDSESLKTFIIDIYIYINKLKVKAVFFVCGAGESTLNQPKTCFKKDTLIGVIKKIMYTQGSWGFHSPGFKLRYICLSLHAVIYKRVLLDTLRS